jgi:hypothetical protein
LELLLFDSTNHSEMSLDIWNTDSKIN